MRCCTADDADTGSSIYLLSSVGICWGKRKSKERICSKLKKKSIDMIMAIICVKSKFHSCIIMVSIERERIHASFENNYVTSNEKILTGKMSVLFLKQKYNLMG